MTRGSRSDEAGEGQHDLTPEIVERTDAALTDAYANLITVFMGQLVAGADGAVLGAAIGPPLGQLVSFMRERLLPVRQQSVAQMLRTVEDRAGLAMEDFLRSIRDDPLRLLLLADAVDAASRSVLETKIDALAATLVAGALADDDAAVHAESLVLAALADVETPHVAVLSAMLTKGRYGIHGRSWSTKGLAEELPQYRRVMSPVLATLARHGLVLSEPPDVVRAMRDRARADNATGGGGADGLGADPGPSTWRLTGFGKRVLCRLEERGAGEEPTLPEEQVYACWEASDRKLRFGLAGSAETVAEGAHLLWTGKARSRDAAVRACNEALGREVFSPEPFDFEYD